jgi:hypothetical protein
VSSMKERDVARQLAEREGLDPPAGLLERIKSEIPAAIQLGAAAPSPEAKETRGMPARQRWLLAASLVAMVGAGFFALRVREQAPALAEKAAPGRKRPAVSAGSPSRQPQAEPGPSGAPDAASLGNGEPELRRDAAASMPQVPPPPKALSRTLPMGVAGGTVGTVEGGVEGGVVGGVPSPPPAKAAPVQPVGAPEPLEAELTVLAESPLRDERQPARQRENKKEYEDFDNFGENAAVEPASPAAPTGASAPAPPPLAAPFRDAAAGRRVTFGPGEDSGSCEHARRELAAGRLPEPGSVRVGDFLGFLDSAGAGRVRLEKEAPAAAQAPAPARAQLLVAEGAPNPFGNTRSRLLLFRLRGGAAVPAGARMEVELNPAVVARYREIGAGPGLSALYEVELRDDAASGRIATPIATVRVRGLPNGGGEERELALSGLAPTWDGASPGFRLAALAAELAESLKGYPWAPGDLGAIARQIREAARGVPGNPRAAELADLAEAAARLRGNSRP